MKMDAYDDDHNSKSTKDISNGFNGPSYITSNKDGANDVSSGGELLPLRWSTNKSMKRPCPTTTPSARVREKVLTLPTFQ